MAYPIWHHIGTTTGYYNTGDATSQDPDTYWIVGPARVYVVANPWIQEIGYEEPRKEDPPEDDMAFFEDPSWRRPHLSKHCRPSILRRENRMRAFRRSRKIRPVARSCCKPP